MISPSSKAHLTRAALAALLLGFGGCVNPPDPARHESDLTPGDHWTALAEQPADETAPSLTVADASSQPPVDWLESFGDPTLVDLVNEALEKNPDLRALAQTVSAARAAARIDGADRLPQASLGLDASRRQIVVEDGAEPLRVRSDQGSLGLNVSWEIDIWGRLTDRAAAAVADLQAAEADLAAARLSLAGQIARAWFRASAARQLLQLAEATVESFDATARLVRDRFQTGVSSSLELRLALANAAAAHALLQQRTQELDAATRRLEALLGRYPSRQLETVDTLPEIPLSIPAGLPSELLHRRPDILAAERRLAAADARVRAARKALLPSLRLTGSAGTASEDLENLLDADFSVWSIAAGLTQPLFQGGRLRANVELREAGAERAHADYIATLINAFGEVETRLAAEALLRQREKNLAEAADHSEGAERLARDEYEAGLADIFSVLESQRRALDARSAYIRVREERLNNRVDLHLALGGGFEAPSATTAATGSSSPSSLSNDTATLVQTR
ncbi:MAG: efflux transporter outer membrane subunit [Verrucomicrobia bacterium]|nr:MAG: efflux transporter outer membrane subunit [Verrucomicrobiota bacterium]